MQLRGREAYRRVRVVPWHPRRWAGPAANIRAPPATSRRLRFASARRRREVPTDEDLFRIVSTASRHEHAELEERGHETTRRAVVAYVRTFAEMRRRSGRSARSTQRLATPTAARTRRARARLFTDDTGGGCAKCHGEGGRGDGPSAPTLVDDRQHPIPATLRVRGPEGRSARGGHRSRVVDRPERNTDAELGGRARRA